jgi:hypothetical protein
MTTYRQRQQPAREKIFFDCRRLPAPGERPPVLNIYCKISSSTPAPRVFWSFPPRPQTHFEYLHLM